MSQLKSSRVVLHWACMSMLLIGCTGTMMHDFHNGTEIAQFDIGKVGTVAESIDLPRGEADIAFVVRDYDCKQPLNASINVMVQLADGTPKQRMVNLGEITWPVSGQDCRPIGYLRLQDAKYTRPLRMTISRKSNPVRFAFTVTQAADAGRQMSIWVVYNDRNPVDRMLGSGSH